MNDEIWLENYVDGNGVRHVHVMSNLLIENPSEIFGAGTVAHEAGIWHFKVCEPMRGLVKLVFEGGSQRVAALWSLDGYASVRAAIADAVAHFEDKTNIDAEFAFMRKLPSMVEDGYELGNVILIESEWVMPKYVVVCARERGL